MANVTVQKDRYTVDPLYQWDLNQVLEIRGLSLPSIPEIHFTNEAMDRAIVKQASVDDAGVITVDVPNSLLQKPYKITAYVCIYEGKSFQSLYSIAIPVKARNKPNDYTLEGDSEIYSFNALENYVNNTVANLVATNDKAIEDLENYVDSKVAGVSEYADEINASVLANADAITDHVNNTKNPHGVDCKQIGAAPAIESEDYPGCYYRIVDGEQEWINPPIITDIEFKTTEKIVTSTGIKPLYMQMFKRNCAAETSEKLLANVVVTDFVARTNSFILPRTTTTTTLKQDIDVWRDGSYKYIQGSDVTETILHIQLWYYKT